MENEKTTRKQRIDLQLARAGWGQGSLAYVEECLIRGDDLRDPATPYSAGDEFADYELPDARHVDSYITPTPARNTTLLFGLGYLRVACRGGPSGNALQKMFGVRTELNRLILAPVDRKSLKKFLRMLGEEKTSRGLAFHKAILHRSTKLSKNEHN